MERFLEFNESHLTDDFCRLPDEQLDELDNLLLDDKVIEYG